MYGKSIRTDVRHPDNANARRMRMRERVSAAS